MELGAAAAEGGFRGKCYLCGEAGCKAQPCITGAQSCITGVYWAVAAH